jgi:glycosyltransferase involved in cell wall biosynthesis
MKILCVIDTLGSGGAQRQMVNLACGLKANGHDIEMFVYFPQFTFFRPELESAQIPVYDVKKGRGFSFKVLRYLSELFRKQKYDAVISFLNVPSFYAELAKLLVCSKTPLISGERSNSYGGLSRFQARLFRWSHCLASAVVANSQTHTEWLRRHSWLRNKCHTIYNGYCLSQIPEPSSPRNRSPHQYLVVGRVQKVKNGLRLIDALALYAKKHHSSPIIRWAGRQETDNESLQYRRDMENRLKVYPEVAEKWEWLGERNDIPQLLANCDALIHVSLYEGLPNVVCEAFIAARPVIVSNVCDHAILVDDPDRGFLCDPESPESICGAIEKYEAQTEQLKSQQGTNARKYAEKNLSIEKMVAAYETIIVQLRDQASR